MMFNKMIEGPDYWAVSTQAPPTALIFSSACLEKNLAFTMTGCLGRAPFPSTLKEPALEQSMTGALSLDPAYFSLVCSETRDQSLSRLILWWCCPPAFPLPPGCFLCLPILPWPWDTWPLNFLVFFLLVDIFHSCRSESSNISL